MTRGFRPERGRPILRSGVNFSPQRSMPHFTFFDHFLTYVSISIFISISMHLGLRFGMFFEAENVILFPDFDAIFCVHFGVAFRIDCELEL